MNTAMDAAAALIFHHGELMTLNGVPAADIIKTNSERKRESLERARGREGGGGGRS